MAARNRPIKDKVSLNLLLPGALVKDIEQYRFKHKFDTRSEAMRFLMSWALEQDPSPEYNREG